MSLATCLSTPETEKSDCGKQRKKSSLMLHLGGEQRKQSRDSETVRINMSFHRERIRAEGKRFA